MQWFQTLPLWLEGPNRLVRRRCPKRSRVFLRRLILKMQFAMRLALVGTRIRWRDQIINLTPNSHSFDSTHYVVSFQDGGGRGETVYEA